VSEHIKVAHESFIVDYDENTLKPSIMLSKRNKTYLCRSAIQPLIFRSNNVISIGRFSEEIGEVLQKFRESGFINLWGKLFARSEFYNKKYKENKIRSLGQEDEGPTVITLLNSVPLMSVWGGFIVLSWTLHIGERIIWNKIKIMCMTANLLQMLKNKWKTGH